ANVAGKTLLQRIAPEALLARVFGVLEGLTMFGFALGTFLAELAIATLGIGGALVVVGVAIPALLALLWNPITAIDRHARAIDAEALALLLAQPIFAPLSAPAIERILAELTHVDIPAGQAIIREGDVGDRYYLIERGRVEVSARGERLSERGPGDGFGEIALLRDVPRTATVTATTPVELIAIERDRFLAAVTGRPPVLDRADARAAEQLAVGGVR